MPGIFVCYRREDSIAHAGRLYDRLVQHFGPRQPVFMDIDNVEPGDDFVDVIQQMAASCDVLIAVIGRHWLAAKDEYGRQRLEQAEDFVRLEIEAALDRNIRVIPALVGGARMPRPQELPDALRKLTRRQAIEISDISFHPSVTKLIASMEKAISAAKEQRQVSAKEMVEQTARISDAAAHINASPLTNEKDSIIKQLRLAASSRETRKVGTQRRYNFTVWIEGPGAILAMIEHVQYDFVYDPNPLTAQSSDLGSKFAVGYDGWGCYDTVVVTVQPRGQELQRRTFNMCSVLK